MKTSLKFQGYGSTSKMVRKKTVNRSTELKVKTLAPSFFLRNLHYRDKIQYRVCKRWRCVANDNSLWRHVDLLPYKLNLKKTWKVIRSHLSECLLTIKLKGYMESQGPRWSTLTVSNAILEDLSERCPNICEMQLHNVCIDGLDSSKFPHTLTKLTLHKCSWPKGWMKKANLPNLRHLNLTNTVRIDSAEVDDFVKFTHLETLSLKGCYRVKEVGLRNIAENLTGLQSLNISDTVCTDLALHHISRNLKQLTSLEMVSCKAVTSGGVASIGEGLPKLTHLNISNCSSLDDSCLQSIYNMKKLRVLKQNLKLSTDQIYKLEIHFQDKL